MARSAVQQGPFTGKQGQQGVNKLVVFACVAAAVVVAGLPFISREVRRLGVGVYPAASSYTFY